MKCMSDSLTEKIDRIEALLLEVNADINNLPSFEELDEAEQAEVKAIRKSVETAGRAGFKRLRRVTEVQSRLLLERGTLRTFAPKTHKIRSRRALEAMKPTMQTSPRPRKGHAHTQTMQRVP